MTPEKLEQPRDDLENRVKVTKIDWGLCIPLMYAVIKFESIRCNSS